MNTIFPYTLILYEYSRYQLKYVILYFGDLRGRMVDHTIYLPERVSKDNVSPHNCIHYHALQMTRLNELPLELIHALSMQYS